MTWSDAINCFEYCGFIDQAGYYGMNQLSANVVFTSHLQAQHHCNSDEDQVQYRTKKNGEKDEKKTWNFLTRF